MGTTPTPVNAWQVPDVNELIKNTWARIRDLGLAIEPYSVMRFSSFTDLAAKLTGGLAPSAGMLAFLADTQSLYLYASGAWKRVYPSERTVFINTGTPASNLGAVGDIYYQV